MLSSLFLSGKSFHLGPLPLILDVIKLLSIVTGDPFHYTGKWEKRFDPGMQAAKADWPMMQFLQNRKSNVNAMVRIENFIRKLSDRNL